MCGLKIALRTTAKSGCDSLPNGNPTSRSMLCSPMGVWNPSSRFAMGASTGSIRAIRRSSRCECLAVFLSNPFKRSPRAIGSTLGTAGKLVLRVIGGTAGAHRFRLQRPIRTRSVAGASPFTGIRDGVVTTAIPVLAGWLRFREVTRRVESGSPRRDKVGENTSVATMGTTMTMIRGRTSRVGPRTTAAWARNRPSGRVVMSCRSMKGNPEMGKKNPTPGGKPRRAVGFLGNPKGAREVEWVVSGNFGACRLHPSRGSVLKKVGRGSTNGVVESTWGTGALGRRFGANSLTGGREGSLSPPLYFPQHRPRGFV